MSETDEERGGLENTVAFTKAAGKGVYAAGEGIVTGFWALGKAAVSAGEELVTSPEYREDLWNKTIEAADAASDYASGVAEDPQKLVNDVSDGIDRVRDAVSEAYADYKRAEAEAIAEGRAAEFYGNIAGHGLVEVGSTVVPVGAAAKLSKVSKFAKAVDKAEDLTDAVPGGPLSGKQKARLAEEANKDVPDTPCAAAATTKCPKVKEADNDYTNLLDERYVSQKINDLKEEGHGPQRHEGQVTPQNLDERVRTGKLPDGTQGKVVRSSTKINSEQSYVQAYEYIKNTKEYEIGMQNIDRLDEFGVTVPLEQVYGKNYLQHVSGKIRVGSVKNPVSVDDVDLTDGRITAFFRIENGKAKLITLYPEKNK